MGNPAAPLDQADAKCHAAIGKSFAKQFSTVVKTRTKCQNLAEKDGATDPPSCAGGAWCSRRSTSPDCAPSTASRTSA